MEPPLINATRAPIASDLGFRLGPRINAGGRVGKSDLGVRLLTTQNPEEADSIAAELEHFNEERRAIEAAVTEQAIELGRHDARLELDRLATRGGDWRLEPIS